MYQDLQYETNDGIATVTIDRPDVRNAFRRQTIQELNDALRRVDDDDSVYAAVLTGTDGFCAGADVNEMPDWNEQPKEEYAAYLWKVQNVVRSIRDTPKSVVAAVAGPAIGAGCDFALACDVRIVAPEATLREGFVRVGLVPGDGGAWLLPRLIGESKAKEYLLTGKDITPDDAVDLGLAVEIDDDPVGAATEFAESLLENPAVAVRGTKRLVNTPADFETHCKDAIDYQWECVNDPEHEEAISAFLEKREPSYDREYEE